MDQSTLSRFLAKVQKTPSCWNWIGSTNGHYGQLSCNDKLVRAHRLSYEHYIGPIPPGLQGLHRCDNTLCVKPKHLFLGTRADNTKDSVEKGRHWSKTQPHTATRGERSAHAKLTSDQVKQIRMMASKGKHQARIAEHFGVNFRTISDIIRRKKWAHL